MKVQQDLRSWALAREEMVERLQIISQHLRCVFYEDYMPGRYEYVLWANHPATVSLYQPCTAFIQCLTAQ